jgi:hypothetical protein
MLIALIAIQMLLRQLRMADIYPTALILWGASPSVLKGMQADPITFQGVALTFLHVNPAILPIPQILNGITQVMRSLITMRQPLSTA